MKVTLEYVTPDAENFIGKMAGICYDAIDSPERNIKRAAKCAQDGHLATLRFAHAVFHVSGISRTCSHQFVRSKHLDFLQQSQRYVKQANASYVIPEAIERDDDLRARFVSTVLSAKSSYEWLMSNGVKKEDARFILPEASETSLNVVGNLQAWRDFIKLRADKHAQWEIRNVAIAINNILAKECPNLFTPMESF